MFKTHLRRSVRRPVFNKPVPTGPSRAPVRTGRCVALVDARFLTWLTQGSDERSGAQAFVPSDGLLGALANSLQQAGLELDVVRAYWYSDQVLTKPLDDLVQRSVLDPDADGGLSLMRAMSHDLVQLASHRAAEHVLVVSDDERLLPAVDQAQLHGVAVHLLMDEAGADFEKLQRDDPSWARLLAQADRRVLMVSAPGVVGREGRDSRTSPEQVDTAELQATIGQELQTWWDEEPEAQRIDLQDELRYSRSIPQEVDRQLLLRLSRNLGHPLSWPEKKIMREGVRRIVLGNDFTPYQSEPAQAALHGAVSTADTVADTVSDAPASWLTTERAPSV